MSNVNEDVFELGCIAMYFNEDQFCDDTRGCMGGHAPNRHRLLVGIVHAYRYLKGDSPFDSDPVYLSRNEWLEKISEVDELYPELKLFNAFSRSGRFGTFNELAERDFLHKKSDPNDKRGSLFSVNTEKMACAVCIVRNNKFK